MKTKHVSKFIWVLVLAAALIIPSLASAQKRGGTMVMLVQPEPPNLASYISTSAPIGMVAAKVYDGLAEYDFDLKPIPSLAESWDISPDGKTITFKLRKGVQFHDGKPFTSADVKFTVFEVLKKFHPRGASTFRDVTAIDTPDPHTAIFRLQTPAPYLMMALSGYESPMVPKHLFENTDIRNHPNANKPIGTGPFKFVEWNRGQFVRLDRNANYWKKDQPYLDRVVVRFIPDSATRTAALEKGEAHFAGMGAIYYSDVRQLEKLPHISVTTKGYEMSSPIVELYFNTQKKPFDNPKVRQAISYAIDRQVVIDNVWFGFGKPATGPINSNFKVFYTDKVKNYQAPNGIEIANKLLDEAGYPRGANGIRFEIVHDLTPYGEEWRRFGEYVQQVLERLHLRHRRQVASDHHPLAVVGREDADARVGGHQRPVHRHVQQHVGRAEAQVMPAPDHVAQVVVHVVVGRERQRGQLHAQRVGQRLREFGVDARAIGVEGRHVLVQADHQGAARLHLVQRRGREKTGQRRQRAGAQNRTPRDHNGFSRRVSR